MIVVLLRCIGWRVGGDEDSVDSEYAPSPFDHLHHVASRVWWKMLIHEQICALGATIGLSPLGLAVVRKDEHPRPRASRNPSLSSREMTALAPYPPSNLTSSFGFDTPPPSARSASEGLNGKARSGNARVGQKRVLTPRASFSAGMDRPIERGDGNGSRTGTPTAQSQSPSWLRRLSSSMSTSRDSGHAPSSRPGSAAVSTSNASAAFSQSGSTTPIFPDSTPPALPPNRLVKRTSSVRSTSGSPYQSTGSRLPIPVFRRPATSHQRSADLQESLSGADQGDHMSIDEKPARPRDSPLQHFFTPKIASSDLLSARRRSSSGIPNPIRRVYPDRKYTPVLVSARDVIMQAQVEMDDGISLDDDTTAVTKLQMAPSVASSPLPVQTSHFEQGQTPRRSFSIGDLLSTGPQPLWRRPSQTKGKTSGSKLVRKGRQRVVSAPQAAMGSAFSRNLTGDSERPAKRRDLTDPLAGQRSIYSSASSNQHADTNSSHAIQLNLGTDTPQSTHLSTNNSPFTETSPHVQTTAPTEQRRLPSATIYSAAAKPARVSAAQSEITSTVGSDSEYRSVGDASTDYQTDTPFDSYPTRTTRSSSGRRGPPIETIFDDSPPTFSSGRSTRLKDFLNDGVFAGDHDTRYRHSTIEEEESTVSTPVRSLRDRSVTSTPSARAGASQGFHSSPPAMPMMPDPDEIDWDAPDEQPTQSGLGIQQRSSAVPNHHAERTFPFRFGPALRHPVSMSAGSTPQRANGSSNDRATLFDWSEAQPSPSQNQSPPRPRTVHGKKDPESRGSRPAGRRPPSGMHARSHSVPVVPDVEGKRNNVVANKFGTWGVGSKAVTEDWNDDFDFEEAGPVPVADEMEIDERRIDSGHEMFVPRSIREQQENVVAHIGLLREWGLLIEELKDLRIRAVALDMMNGPYAHAWQEVDAMIELADQETEEQTLEPRRSPPSSPGFDYSAFEEPMPNIDDNTRLREQSIRLPEPAYPQIDVSAGVHRTAAQPNTAQTSLVARPRKDSEAVARSVIEALQSRRSVSDPTTVQSTAQSKKVPFDTATLRHIVPYVNGLKRKVKDALRETEGLYSSPRRRTSAHVNGHDDEDDDEPHFRSIFNGPHADDSAVRRKARRDQAATDHDGFETFSTEQHADLATRMQNMNLPR